MPALVRPSGSTIAGWPVRFHGGRRAGIALPAEGRDHARDVDLRLDGDGHTEQRQGGALGRVEGIEAGGVGQGGFGKDCLDGIQGSVALGDPLQARGDHVGDRMRAGAQRGG